MGKHIDLYGEHVELVSDPFEKGDCIAVHAISERNPTVRTIELPVSILAGWEDLFKEPSDPSDSIALPASSAGSSEQPKLSID